MPKTDTKKLGTKKAVVKETPAKEVEKITIPEVVITAPVVERKFLGTIGLLKVVKIGKKVINEREYNEVLTADGQTYYLSDSDLSKQLKKE